MYVSGRRGDRVPVESRGRWAAECGIFRDNIIHCSRDYEYRGWHCVADCRWHDGDADGYKLWPNGWRDSDVRRGWHWVHCNELLCDDGSHNGDVRYCRWSGRQSVVEDHRGRADEHSGWLSELRRARDHERRGRDDADRGRQHGHGDGNQLRSDWQPRYRDVRD